MKNFFSKNWKRIIYILTAILIIVDLVFIIITPNTIIDDFYEYGPDYKRPDIIINVNEDAIKNEENSLANTLSTNASMSDDLARGVVFLAVGILVILVISNFVEGGGSSSAKKK